MKSNHTNIAINLMTLIHTYARFRINLRLSSVNCNDGAHKMPKNRHFGAGSDTMQQVHGAGVNSNLKMFRVNMKIYYK